MAFDKKKWAEEYNKRYWLAHRASLREKERQRRLANPEATREKDRKKNLAGRETRREYRKKNRKRITIWQRQSRHNNLVIRLADSLRSRIYLALRGISKSTNSMNLLGCSFSDVWTHLESKFVPGMTRDNYGPVWHVDHIRPCASFDLTDPAQQRECFHYTNLQPLFVLDNLKKGSR